MDRLLIMKTFTVVIETGKFSTAARKLGISPALVSHHISTLEKQLGVRLLNRTTRAFVQTEAGLQYYEFSKKILIEIATEDALVASMTAKAEGTLAIVSPKWIGGMELGDAIAMFACENPRIKVRLDLGGLKGPQHRFMDEGYDLAFQTRPLKNSGLLIKNVATLPFVLCAAPSYLKKRKGPLTPDDLSMHSCLVHNDDQVWRFRANDEIRRTRMSHIAFSSNTYLVLQKAAMHGMGIAAMPLRSIYKEVQMGALKILLPDYPMPDRPLYIAIPQGRQRVPKVSCFVDFISNWFGAPPA